MFIASTLKAQDGYIFTKEQHDQIRKNLADYKILIKDYDDMSTKYQHKFDSMSRNFNLMVKEYQFYKELHSKTNTEFKKYEVLYQNSEYENQKLKNQIEILKQKVLNLEPEMARKDRMIIHWKAKYARERKYDKGERIIANFVFGTMVGGSIIAIWSVFDHKHF
jgi:hypothetical protein